MFHAGSNIKALKNREGCVRSNLDDVLQGMQGRGFAKNGNMPRKASGSFRHLTWSDLAVKHPIAPIDSGPALAVAPEDHEADAADEVGKDEAAEVPEATEAGAHAASLNDDASHTAPGVPMQVETPEPAVDDQILQKIRDDAYAEGLSVGKAMTESEREAELAQQFNRLRDLIEGITATDVLDIATLSKSLERAVLDLASQRVGFVLTEMPDILAGRIEKLVQNLAHLSGRRELFLAPDDVPLVQSSFLERQHSPQIHIIADPALRRGDARLRIGGVQMSDLMSETEKPTAQTEGETV